MTANKAYLAQENLYVPQGGETCAASADSNWTNARHRGMNGAAVAQCVRRIGGHHEGDVATRRAVARHARGVGIVRSGPLYGLDVEGVPRSIDGEKGSRSRAFTFWRAPVFRQLLASALRAAAYEVVEVSNGADLFEVLNRSMAAEAGIGSFARLFSLCSL